MCMCEKRMVIISLAGRQQYCVNDSEGLKSRPIEEGGRPEGV